ncbi:MAG: hypothetical protein ACRDTG_10605 [Pseudonocardiaceae bacterium]
MERLEVVVDPTTAAFLRRQGGTLAAAAALQLRRSAVADAASPLAGWYAEQGSAWVEDAERERAMALAELI